MIDKLLLENVGLTHVLYRAVHGCHRLAQGQDAAPYPGGGGQQGGGQGGLTLLGVRHSRHHKKSWHWAGVLQSIHSVDRL